MDRLLQNARPLIGCLSPDACLSGTTLAVTTRIGWPSRLMRLSWIEMDSVARSLPIQTERNRFNRGKREYGYRSGSPESFGTGSGS